MHNTYREETTTSNKYTFTSRSYLSLLKLEIIYIYYQNLVGMINYLLFNKL